MKHTPGPWIVTTHLNNGTIHINDNAAIQSTLVLICHNKERDEVVANARLVCAAPELLEALKEFLRCGPHAGQNRDLLDQVKQAIEKATGGAE